MRTNDAIAGILRKESVDFVSCFPSTGLIDATSALGIRPVVCRQERVGVGIADGYSRVTNGRRTGVFLMQYGPGSENAYAGVATAYSDSSPILLLPMGHARSRAEVFPHFSSARNYAGVTKWVETIKTPAQVGDVMRRAFSYLRNGRPGPVMVETPADVGGEEAGDPVSGYSPVPFSTPAGSAEDVERASRAILAAQRPMIVAGQGVLYAEASPELQELAELLSAPVMTTLEGKSAFPENHPLSLGSGALSTTPMVMRFLRDSDLVIAVGASLTRQGGAMSVLVPAGKVAVQVTNDWRDLNKDYAVQFPILGDARLVLRQLIEALRPRLGQPAPRKDVTDEISAMREEWLRAWMPKLTSNEVPINPYRVVWEFMSAVDARQTIVTHDSGSSRNMLLTFYNSTTPRGYLGWGKSHALGTGLGLIMGAKLAAPEKFCANFMGDGAFGMTGLDFETAVRSRIPITTIVLNNSMMADGSLKVSHEKYATKLLGGNYADMGRAMGGYAERVTEPGEVRAAIQRAMKMNSEGRATLLEFITREETSFSEPQPFGQFWA